MPVRWLLIDLFQTHHIKFDESEVKFDKHGRTTPEYHKISPKGRVPALIIDGKTLVTESIAIMLLLAERHPEADLAPVARNPARSLYLETMVFLANTMLPSFRDYWYGSQDGRAEDEKAIKYLAVTHFELGWDLLDEQLEGKAFLMGESPTVADFMLVCMVIWVKNIPTDPLKRQNLRRLVREMMERESWKEFKEKEHLQFEIPEV
ncbi:MAG: hypothetical protein TREMPRED_005416 [Tremellales sp. Tagirdzhanova-0007]|nr:MAG: hypothetical protein TREMPRED_005416 [Tremellales sp. Tagirdzhanova-0007]